jgi:carbon storage regulator
MLILSRKPGESIVIDGRIRVKIVRVEGEVVKVGIDAPADVPAHRQEVYEEIQRNNQQALTRPKAPLPRLPLTNLPKSPKSSLAAFKKPAAALTKPVTPEK